MQQSSVSQRFVRLAFAVLATGLVSLATGGCPPAPVPTEPSLEPTAGPTAGGTAVTIRGEGFVGSSGVLFGSVAAADFEVVNDRLIIATSPTHEVGLVDVTVVTPTPPVQLQTDQGADVVVGQFEFLAPEPAPRPVPATLGGISPTEGPVAGGTAVTLSGAAMPAGSTVLFGDLAAEGVEVATSELVRATTPAADGPGFVDVTLITPDGESVTLPGAFEYLADAPPAAFAVETLTPVEGSVAGGTVLTVRGTAFSPGMGVFLGGAPARGVEVINSRTLTAIAPAGRAGGVDLEVRHPDGQGARLLDAFTYFVQPIDPGTDTDNDGRTDVQEFLGYEITIDRFGFGTNPLHLVRRHVTSDPRKADTDEDGLDDLAEFVNKSDPRDADTDADGLFDNEEVVRWLTSPISVDTDGDARGLSGDLPPNASLFDGAELIALRDADGFLLSASGQRFVDASGNRLPPKDIERVIIGGTSPTLDDTDGDGASDYEEFDDPVRSPLVADLPAAEISIVDDAYVALFVEYAESAGTASEYGTTLSQSTSATLGTAESESNSLTQSLSASIGFDSTAGFTASTTAGVEITNSGSTTWTQESTTASQQEFSRLESESQIRTETAASGEIRLGLKITNTGELAFSLTNLAVTVRRFQPQAGDPDTSGAFRTVGTLEPTIPDVTLGPGASTDVIEVNATNVNPQLIRQFLARPTALSYDTVGFELENAEGINFTFLTEATFGRTALIIIDYGDGTFEEFRVATNIDRDPGTAAFRGITLRQALAETLGVTYGTTDPAVTGHAFLKSVTRADGTLLDSTPGQSRWVVFATPGVELANRDFDDVVLRNRDEVRLVYVRDDDGDGLLAREELLWNTDDNSPHSDRDPSVPGDVGDGLTDFEEVRVGWEVTALGETRRVFSDPRSIDADNDGLDDAAERAAGTDPYLADTDRDSLPDGVDPFPTVAANRFYVHAAASGAGDGSSWGDAFPELSTAISQATQRNADGDPQNDISEIWVAAGTYRAGSDASATFNMVNNCTIYGGFLGNETRLIQRNPDPLTNGCVLSGDLNGDDGANFSNYDDNTLLLLAPSPSINSTAVIDGFLLSSAQEFGVRLVGPPYPTVRNLFVTQTAGLGLAGAGFEVSGGGKVVLADVTINGNRGLRTGGLSLIAGADVDGFNLEISDNVATETTNGPDVGGGMLVRNGSRVRLYDSRVLRNSIQEGPLFCAGGVFVGRGGRLEAHRTTFEQNLNPETGAAAMMVEGDAVLVNTTFWRNALGNGALTGASAVYVNYDANNFVGGRLWASNCTLAYNTYPGSDNDVAALWVEGSRQGFGDVGAEAYIRNCIFWGNDSNGNTAERFQAYGDGASNNEMIFGTLDVRTSCIQGLGQSNPPYGDLVGNGNTGGDPAFVAGATGNLALRQNSNVIDLANALIDIDPFASGLQFLPPTDFDGNPRIVDGDGDGQLDVDMGAFEFQGAGQ